MIATATIDVNGFVIVLAHIRNIYPVTKSNTGWGWGFKFTDGFYETFVLKTEREASEQRERFLEAIEAFWRSQQREKR